jgi:hypothetical protein
VATWVTKSDPYATVMIFPAWFADTFSGLYAVSVYVTDGTVAGSWSVTDVGWIIWVSSTCEVTEFLDVGFTANASPSAVALAPTIYTWAVVLVACDTVCVLHTVYTVVVG